MSTAGLTRKFGIKPGMTLMVRDAPAHFGTLPGDLPEGVKLLETSSTRAYCVIAFVRSKADIQSAAPTVLDAVIDDGLLWFAYPKKSGSMKTDISRDDGWDAVFERGFDSVAQISIDETWTGFRFRPKHLSTW